KTNVPINTSLCSGTFSILKLKLFRVSDRTQLATRRELSRPSHFSLARVLLFTDVNPSPILDNDI
ncbi:MAG: hypothetical protein MHPSP_002056, partial [Paramarteilia canceri]